MVSILLSCGVALRDTLIAELYEAGTTGIVEREEELEAFFDANAEPAGLVARFAAFDPRLRQHAATDYVEQFRSAWQPARVGKRFWLALPWETSEVPENRFRLEYQPGMACGSGAHPATQLCLEALERCAAPGCAVLDVGAGSGILLVAAGLLGAGLIAGCDIDADSVAAAREAAPRAHFWVGRTEAARCEIFDVVIANISASAAAELAPELRRLARPGGRVIVSGFQKGESGPVDAMETIERDGWVCLILPA